MKSVTEYSNPLKKIAAAVVAQDLRSKKARRVISAFTLAELIVVVTILAILASVGFIALSGYVKDAADARSKSNVRSVYAAIWAESAVTGNSPRYYVVHVQNSALSWGFVTFDASNPPSVLTGWSWNEPGTNYSAGTPDYVKLKLNPEKFKVSSFQPIRTSFAATSDLTAPSVWAADVTVTQSSGKTRTVSYYQAVAIQPSGTAFVVGNYPVNSTWSVSGLIKDPSSPSLTWAIVEWASPGNAVACASVTLSGYLVPWLADGASATVLKPLANGSSNATVTCAWGSLSFASESLSCDNGYSLNGSSCVANAWAVPSWSSCSWETGTWGYSAWGACSLACWWGTQSRTASCTRNSNGTQTRSPQCLRYDSAVLADSACLSAKPATSQSCTQWTDAVCWTVAAVSQACNTQGCPQTGVCSGSPGACSVGSPYSDNGQTACSTTRTWSCTGVNGWSPVWCVYGNSACSVSTTLSVTTCDGYGYCYVSLSCPVTFTKVGSVQCVGCAYHGWNNNHVLAKIQWWAGNSFSFLRGPESVGGWWYAWDGQGWTNCTQDFHNYTPHY